MSHYVTDNCRDCKYTDCVLVCPVDCFYELESQLVIDPEECIDCAACVAECPVEAIYAEDELPEDQVDAIQFNTEAAAQLKDEGAEPITDQKEPLSSADAKKAQLGY